MSEPLSIDEGGVGRAMRLVDPREGHIAVLGEHTHPSWLSRLARVPLLEASLKRMLRQPVAGEVTAETIAAREEAAKLCEQIETCRCGRTVGAEERCESCSLCPSCEELRPCPPLPDEALDSATYDEAARVRY